MLQMSMKMSPFHDRMNLLASHPVGRGELVLCPQDDLIEGPVQEEIYDPL